jgi:DNA-binding transcriptional regulator LsrR (DeoR family)
MKRPRKPATLGDGMDLKIRAAWLYYVEGLTQEQIGQYLRLNRVKVMRLLAAAREENIVRIEINARSTDQIELERRLVTGLGLSEAIVVPSARQESAVARLVGHAAGQFLTDRVRDGMAVATGWGETLSMALGGMERRVTSNVSIVSLLGGMTHSRSVNPSAVARRLADVFGAECFQLTAPVFVSSEDLRRSLWNEPGLQALLQRARAADLALVSVGDVSESSTLFKEGLLPKSELEPLRRAGAVGDVLCQFVDQGGRLVDHPVNRRVMAVSLADIERIPVVAIAAGGARKVAAIRAAIRAVRARVLITDVEAARRLVAGESRKSERSSPADGGLRERSPTTQEG